MNKKTMGKLVKSRTMWLAVLQGSIGIIVALSTEVPELDTVGLLVVLKSVVDILLRLDTNKKLM